VGDAAEVAGNDRVLLACEQAQLLSPDLPGLQQSEIRMLEQPVMNRFKVATDLIE
jgi:hypothetical protein